jgi:hypothetical protein
MRNYGPKTVLAPVMKRVFLLTTLALAAAAPTASARVIELGATTDGAKPSCPAEPCFAAYQVSGYQGRAGSKGLPFRVPRDGYVVAFTVTLGAVTSNQISFFDNAFGSPAQVRLSVLRRGKHRRTRYDHRLIAQTRRFRIDKYFGSSPTLALDAPLRIRKGYYVALTVPTWAPVLANKPPGRNWWRSSRPKGQCGSTDKLAPPSAQERLRSVKKYGCTYGGARLLYTATYIPDPRPTRK